MNLKELALKIAETAHKGQIDKAGKPYINHPIKVASIFEDDASYIIAILHDVVEDSNVTISDLINYGFPTNITDALEAITKRGESYEEYLKKVKSNALATRVKIEDLRHNMDLSRIPTPMKKDFDRIKKYEYAIKYLQK